MQTLIQHNLDTKIAEQISVNFKVFNTHIRHQVSTDLNMLRGRYKVDFNYLPEQIDTSKIRLFVSDMDSTLINIECIDEIADFANLKPKVANITERAMLGELDFDASLIERVALLKDLDVGVLDRVYTQRLEVNPGGRELVQFLKKIGIACAVVSGGFTYFTERLAKDIGLDHMKANVLGIEQGKLTGVSEGKIINAQAKADFVKQLCEDYAINTDQCIVVGDGANDLKMMEVAGISVAYHAKKTVQETADIVINYGGLDKIMDLFIHKH